MLSDKRSTVGRTDTGLMKNIILNKSCNVLKFTRSAERKSKHTNEPYTNCIPVATEAFNFSLREIMSLCVSTVSIFGNNEKYNNCKLNHDIQYLKADVFVISPNVILVSEWTISRNQLW